MPCNCSEIWWNTQYKNGEAISFNVIVMMLLELDPNPKSQHTVRRVKSVGTKSQLLTGFFMAAQNCNTGKPTLGWCKKCRGTKYLLVRDSREVTFAHIIEALVHCLLNIHIFVYTLLFTLHRSMISKLDTLSFWCIAPHSIHSQRCSADMQRYT